MVYKKHLFFCINQRKSGKPCCQDHDAEGMVSYAKSAVKRLGLKGPGGVRVNKAGCLGRCALGPCVVIYPEGVWYRYHGKADIDRIIEQHCLNGRVVSDLLIPDDPIS
jgi:(2Fe-2S) ferredoxin